MCHYVVAPRTPNTRSGSSATDATYGSHWPYAGATPQYSGQDGVNIAAIAFAAGGRNLLAGTPFGNADDWTRDERNPPKVADPTDEIKQRTQDLSDFWAVRQHWERESATAMGNGKVFTGNIWGHSQNLLYPLAMGEGDFGTNPQPRQRIDYFRC